MLARLILVSSLPLLVLCFHPETLDGPTMVRPFWHRDHLAQFDLINNETLLFGALNILEFAHSLPSYNETTSCLDLLHSNLLHYEHLVRQIADGNRTVLTPEEVDLVSSFASWGADVKYQLWTLNHWNWVSNDITCKLARFHSIDRHIAASQKSQYCAYEIETGRQLEMNLVVGYCLPDSCDHNEAELVGSRLGQAVDRYWSLLDKNNRSSLDRVTSVVCVPSYQTVQWYQRVESWIILASIIVLFILVVIATILRMSQRSSATNNARQIFTRIFSIQSNVAKLAHVSEQSVGSINGLKTFTMLLMILCHVYLVKQAFTIDLERMRDAFRDHALGPIMYNATYSVGTFFMTTAALQMLVTMTKFHESKNKPFNPTFWICAVVNRYLRLIPLLMFTTALFTELLPYFNFPLWHYIDSARRCPKDYWRQLLLVQNLQDINLCATWTWYLAVDFQLFLMNLPLVCLIQHKPKIGLSVAGILLIVSCVVKSWLIGREGYPPNLMLMTPMLGYEENFSRYSFQIYMRPQGWWSTYLIGLFLGYVLFKYNDRYRRSTSLLSPPIDIPAKLYWPVSIIASLLILWTVFGIHVVAKSATKNQIYDYAYSGLISVAWACGWSWVVYVCHRSKRARYVNRFLSCRPMVFLSNLTYSCYLIHMPFVFGLLFTYSVGLGGGRPRLHHEHWEMILLVIAIVLISYFLALVVNLLVESPAANLQSILIKWIFAKMAPTRSKKTTMRGGDHRGETDGVAEEMINLKSPREKQRRFKEDDREEEIGDELSSSLNRPAERFPTRRI